MVFGKDNIEIVKLATENQSSLFDGVVQFNYETGEVFGCSMSTGTIENTANPFVEIFRLKQGEIGEIDCQCNECPFINGFTDEKHKSLYPTTKEECCLETYADVDFEDDWRINFQESVEEEVRDIISDKIEDTINQIDDVRIAIEDKLKPYRYIENRINNTFTMDCLDICVDNMVEYGATLSDLDCNEFIEQIACSYENLCENRDLWTQIANAIRKSDFENAIELLNYCEVIK